MSSFSRIYRKCNSLKPAVGVCEQVRQEPGFTAIEDDMRLEISELKRRIVLSVQRKKSH